MIEKNSIIAFDFQGWPVEKMSLEDIIKRIGGVYNPDTNKYEIECTDKLKRFPVVYEDDGMAYGVNPKYISEVDLTTDEPQLWLDAEDENIDVYLEDETCPGMVVFSPEDVQYHVSGYSKEQNTYILYEDRDVRDIQVGRIVDRDELLRWIKLGEGREV